MCLSNVSLKRLQLALARYDAVVAARHVLHEMLQPDPADRPSAAEVSGHPIFWSTQRAVEAIREVFDTRLMHELTLEEEQKLMGEVWGKGRQRQGEKSGKVMQGWKDQIVPELLQRMKQRARSGKGGKSGRVTAAASDAAAAEVRGRGRKRGKKAIGGGSDDDGTARWPSTPSQHSLVLKPLPPPPPPPPPPPSLDTVSRRSQPMSVRPYTPRDTPQLIGAS